MWAIILGLAGPVLGLLGKFIPGMGSSVATAGDQKAVDEVAAVTASRKLQEVQAQADTTKGDLGAGKF